MSETEALVKRLRNWDITDDDKAAAAAALRAQAARIAELEAQNARLTRERDEARAQIHRLSYAGDQFAAFDRAQAAPENPQLWPSTRKKWLAAREAALRAAFRGEEGR